MQLVHVFHGWMRIDGRSMKSALLNIIKKWSFMFTQHLMAHVTNRCSMFYICIVPKATDICPILKA